MKQWKEERLASRPEELQLIAQPDLYIQRRNIREEHHEETDNMPEYTDYVCDSREITESELAMLESIEEIDTNKAIDEYTLQLMEGGII